MTILLNIGLNTPSGDPVASLGMERIYEAGKLLETFRKRVALHVSDTEETLVVECESEFGMRQNVEKLCELLDQDCIAVMCGSKERGWLIGPRAHEWGEFDPTKFLLLDGSRAA